MKSVRGAEMNGAQFNELGVANLWDPYISFFTSLCPSRDWCWWQKPGFGSRYFRSIIVDFIAESFEPCGWTFAMNVTKVAWCENRCGNRRLRFKSWFCHLLVVWSLTSHLSYVYPEFLGWNERVGLEVIDLNSHSHQAQINLDCISWVSLSISALKTMFS